jgi:hypothetical protein
MSIQTNLSVSPYFDDYDAEKDYYKILFKPGTAVQVRELNQLQTLLQKQTEQFGDHILKTGTILSGCQFSFQTAIPFVKIADITARGSAVNVAEYKNLFVKNSANLVAKVIDVAAGFEAQDPDLNTLYLSFVNSGDSQEDASYIDGSELTIYSNDYRLYGIDILNASQGFSNADQVVITSAIEVQNTAGGLSFANGTFQVNEIITQDTTGAQAVITAVNATANATALILNIKPLTSQLEIANNASWDFRTGFNFNSDVTNNEAVLAGFAGRDATAALETTTVGAIRRITVNFQGNNYYIPPHVTIASLVASQSQINTLNLVAENYKAKVSVATDISSNTFGYAYGVSVTDGSIYQKGHFLRVLGQFAIVDKYANTPSDVAVGFVTEEATVNSAVDFTLVDNAAGFLNENAPGADRLKLIPKLAIKTFNEANEDSQFLSLIKFSEGKHFIINSVTEYNKLGDELARRTFEESGNYVLDTFNLTTRSPVSIANSDTTFTYVIDPGHAYIGGYRVRTERTFARNVNKATETVTVNNVSSDVVYGNYLRVNEFAGLHAFINGQQISLRDTARRYITTSLGTITATGAEIGKARIRSVVYESGIAGTPTAVYRLYLFDIRMNAGTNFKNVKSVFVDNAGLDGIADAVLETVANETTPIAVIKENNKNSLIIDTTLPLVSVDNIRYVYKTTDENVGIDVNGIITVPNDVSAEWPYSGALSRAEKQEVIVIPEENLVSNIALTGTFASRTLISGSTVSTLTGSGTQFAAQLKSGDYIYVNDGANNSIVRIDSIANNTSLTFGPNTGLNDIDGGATISRAYKTGIPIPLADDINTSATIVGNNLVIDVGLTFAASANVSVIYNQRTDDATPVAKSVQRKAYIKIQANTHPAGVSGPWCVGHSDVIRLRGVYLGGTTSGTNLVEQFYIDHNQNENYYDVGYLYKKPTSSYTVPTNAELLVEFDLLTHNLEGIKTINSYNVDDTLSLADMDTDGTVLNTMEIPQLIRKNGAYFDLRESLDFRPKTANTAALESDEGSAPVNPDEPSESTRFSVSDKRFPAPESDVFYDMTYYLPRVDNILVNSENEFEFLIGRELSKNSVDSKNQLLLYRATVPAYPSLPSNLSTEMSEIVKTNVANETFLNRRQQRYTIRTERIDRQVQGYTMAQIAQLERRIAALEYYANLSALEDQVKNRIIPSSVDSTLERFKFGFFVDNFVDYTYTDLSNPEHNSTIYAYVLQPSRSQFNLRFKLDDDFSNLVDNNIVRFPYVKKRLLSQNNATTGSVTPEPPQEPAVATVCQMVINQNLKFATGNANDVFEQYTFELSSNSAADGQEVSLKFNVYGGKDRFEIYQSRFKGQLGQLIYSTSNVIINNLTEEEKRVLDSKGINDTRLTTRGDSKYTWIKSPNHSYISRGIDSKYWFIWTGKFVFPYDFSKGRYITLRNLKGSSSHLYYVCYPADSYADAIYQASADAVQLPPVSSEPSPTVTRFVCTTANTIRQFCRADGALIGQRVDIPGTCVIEENSPQCGYTPPPPQPPVIVTPIIETPIPDKTPDTGVVFTPVNLGQLAPGEADTIITSSTTAEGGTVIQGTILINYDLLNQQNKFLF